MKKAKINVGDRVKWTCKPYKMASFGCVGVVEGFKKACFGGSDKKEMGATVIVKTSKYKNTMGKSKTFVAVRNLVLEN